MTMIEKVARAIAKSQYPDKSENVMWQHFIPDARAALEAMEEPTPQMLIDAGSIRGVDIDSPEIDEDHKEWWRAMLIAALSEGQSE